MTLRPYYQDKYRVIYHGDCRGIVGNIPKVTAVVTDPPYELGFMGKHWDSRGISFQDSTWKLIRGACVSGTPLLSFGGSRTQHRVACAIEDAGWEIRDTLMWVYGSGFPKSYSIAKGIEGVITYGSASWNKWRNLDGEKEPMSWGLSRGQANQGYRPSDYTESNKQRVGSVNYHTSEAELWHGYGTALKPAYEPIILAMNSLDGTFARNALEHGVAGLNIEECRVGTTTESHSKSSEAAKGKGIYGEYGSIKTEQKPYGRFPANFLHDGSDEVLALFPDSKGQQGNVRGTEKYHTGDENTNCYDGYNRMAFSKRNDDKGGSAARFFYCAKASKSERGRDNKHPTVKPLALMEYLVKLVKMPERNLILDPFMGSGTTLLACTKLGIKSIGIEEDEASCEITAKRCTAQTVKMIQEGVY